ncbi:hypothetical protein [Endozoicomonas sp. 4G]|uniref:hypothetical protein n=1 Tax=Endozoicomonas sp. 4G TaxID=2872754 RepID=UPI00207894C9|nr:hypothetical protein [Endozoicomonas sp. 4G]
MLSKKPLILTLAMAFSVHCSNGQAQENRLPLLFLKQEPEENHSDMPEVCFGDDMLLKPDIRYCFAPDPGVEAEAYRRTASDGGSGSGDVSTSDENGDNRSNEDEADTDSNVRYVATTLNPFPVSNEIIQYCTTLTLKKIKQESVSDSEIATESEAVVTVADSTAYSTDQADHLKTHRQIPLSADHRPKRSKIHRCDHEGCNYSTDRATDLKKHKQTHLPADQRAKVHQCDHEGCNYSTYRVDRLKKHKETHLPADQRPKVHQCDHEDCNYRTNHMGNLNMHKQIHLPVDQRLKRLRKSRMRQCDHEGCNYRTRADHLNRHKKTHLPADQRPKRPKTPERPKIHQCDHVDCNYRTYHTGNLKRHELTHLHADQRRKSKAYDQLLSNEKRKKGDKE